MLQKSLTTTILPNLKCLYFSPFCFTSHYVPIKSVYHNQEFFHIQSLHPIMFLLNQRECAEDLSISIFTSHYVPIKSVNTLNNCFCISLFTSHYVPIKSTYFDSLIASNISLHPIMFLLNRRRFRQKINFNKLYIPLCSY